MFALVTNRTLPIPFSFKHQQTPAFHSIQVKLQTGIFGKLASDQGSASYKYTLKYLPHGGPASPGTQNNVKRRHPLAPFSVPLSSPQSLLSLYLSLFLLFPSLLLFPFPVPSPSISHPYASFYSALPLPVDTSHFLCQERRINLFSSGSSGFQCC